MTSDLAETVGVVLAAGRGSRMSPITEFVPKPLLTVNNERLLDLALARLRTVVRDLAVNAHHLSEQVAEAAGAFDARVHVSFERERLLGTAGALAQLRKWIDGRPVLITNGDLWLSGPIDGFLRGWDGNRPRLLVRDMGRAADFGSFRYMGVSTVPAHIAARLQYEPSGLYSALWRDAFARKEIEFVELTGLSFDCGTPAEFLSANFAAAGADSVIAPDAQVAGTLDRSVVLAGGHVGADEHLSCAIRDRFGHTMTADPADIRFLTEADRDGSGRGGRAAAERAI